MNKGSSFSSSRHIQVGMGGHKRGCRCSQVVVTKLEIPFVAEKQVRGSMGKVEYTWSEVFIFKAQNRNMDTPDSIHHHIICTAGLNPESDKLDKHCTTSYNPPGSGSYSCFQSR